MYWSRKELYLYSKNIIIPSYFCSLVLNAATRVNVHINCCQKRKFLSCFTQALLLMEASKMRLTSESIQINQC